MCDSLYESVLSPVTTKLAASANYLDPVDLKNLAGSNFINLPTDVKLGQLYIIVDPQAAVEALTSDDFYNSLADTILSYVDNNKITIAPALKEKPALINVLKSLINSNTVTTCVVRWNNGQPVFLRKGQFENLMRPRRNQVADISRCMIDPAELRARLGVVGDTTSNKLCVVPDTSMKKKGPSNGMWLFIIIIVILIILALIWYYKSKSKAVVVI